MIWVLAAVVFLVLSGMVLLGSFLWDAVEDQRQARRDCAMAPWSRPDAQPDTTSQESER